tara:strand:- start:16165 stop:17754 length:1590 start_codon:yes stop_codon:yes gene_type:complete
VNAHAQRIAFFAAAVVATLLVYFPIASSADRYSLYKVLGRMPASIEEPTLPSHRLTDSEVPNFSQLNQEYTRVIAHVIPSVVSIDTTSAKQVPELEIVKSKAMRSMRMPDGKEATVMIPTETRVTSRDIFTEIPGVGSGVFISEDGHIITNHHVVQGADDILVTTHDQQQFNAIVIGADSTVDLAVLLIPDAGDRKFPVLNFADSESIQPGQIVFAFGNPFGLSESITQGIINGTGRRFYGSSDNAYIQTDAVINPGNSGGPLSDIYGQVVGINVIAYAGEQDPDPRRVRAWQGMGLALPSNRVVRAYEEVMNLGQRKRPYLGVIFNEVKQEMADAVGLEEASGAMIYSLEEDSPARDILQEGDIVLEIGGEPVQSVMDASRTIRSQSPETPVEINVWRKGANQSVKVKLAQFHDVNQIARLPAILSEGLTMSELRSSLGLLLRELTPRDKIESGMPKDLGGIFVWRVDEQSPMSGHVEGYDLIHEINGHPVWTEEDFYTLLSELPTDQPSTMMLTRNRRRYYLEFRPG